MSTPVHTKPNMSPASIVVSAPLTSTPQFTKRRFGWEKWGIWILLINTAVAYLWNLGANGWANSFYTAAVQAGSQNWTAFFYGSSDAANSITVDKPPLSLWVMDLSVRMFGLNSWSMLVPEVLMGVAAVGILYLAVKRWYGTGAGLLAGTILATTPVVALMFRFNNPDALLVLLLVGASYVMVRAVEKASPKWIMLAGALVGLGFLTKMFQAFLVLPAFILIYLVAAQTSWVKKVRDLLLAFTAMIIAGGWWVAIVELVPTSARPYIGGSQNKSVLDLIVGYNGFGRLTGNETGSVQPGGGQLSETLGGPAGGNPFGGNTGIGRLFDNSWSSQISWLLPTAIILGIGGLLLGRKKVAGSYKKVGLILWGGWGLTTWAVFSFGNGIIHEYYAVALAPAIAATIGAGASILWERKTETLPRLVGAGAIVSAGIYAGWIMTQAGTPWSWVGLSIALVASAVGALVGSPAVAGKYGGILALVAALMLVIGPTIFSVQTINAAHTGSIPSAGPQLSGVKSGPGGRTTTAGPVGGTLGQQALPMAGAMSSSGSQATQGGAGLLEAPTVGNKIVRMLNTDADKYTWVAAGVGSMTTAGYQLATGNPVMAVGGFNGTDPSPTLSQFQKYVAEKKIHYFIGGGGFGPGMGSSGTSSEISSWVKTNFPTETIDGVTFYNLNAN